MTPDQIVIKISQIPGVEKVYNAFPETNLIPVGVDGGKKCYALSLIVYCEIEEEKPPDLNVNVGEQLGVKMSVGKPGG